MAGKRADDYRPVPRPPGPPPKKRNKASGRPFRESPPGADQARMERVHELDAQRVKARAARPKIGPNDPLPPGWVHYEDGSAGPKVTRQSRRVVPRIRSATPQPTAQAKSLPQPPRRR